MKEYYLKKIKGDYNEASVVLGQCKTAQKKIIFTNGCFDIIHAGHIQYLYEARQLGDFLVVGVNDDASVKRHKGPKRPIMSLSERMEILSGLEMVDLVVPFAEDTPLNLIQAIKPDILVKGGDYEISEIVGADFVLSIGGEVKGLSFKDGSSTSNIIEKILKNYND